MASGRKWLIIDDQLGDAQAFAASFGRQLDNTFGWEAVQASDAQGRLFARNSDEIAGIFVDVDLSSDGKMVGTGLGLAQDVRATQKNKSEGMCDFPVFRFANPDPVRAYVGDDPASDDLFDLLISKDIARAHPGTISLRAVAIREVYDRLVGGPPASVEDFAAFCGLMPDTFETWGDLRFWHKVRLGLAPTAATHVAAGAFVRTFLLPDGLLVSEDLLAVRLGVDRVNSPGWSDLCGTLDGIRYQGIGALGFARWWARGLAAHWLTLDPEEYLHQRTSEERVAKLVSATGLKLRPIEPAAPYWRLCALSKQINELRPIDPGNAVTLVPRVPLDLWVEPDQAEPSVAVMMRNDPRVDPDELARFVK